MTRPAAWVGLTSPLVPIPATYVVDQSSMIVDEYVNPDFRKRMEPADMIAALKSL